MEVLYFFLFCIALITPALLVFYDVCFPSFSLKILREKIFLKLGILGVYAYPPISLLFKSNSFDYDFSHTI